jgi:hypothetical protein
MDEYVETLKNFYEKKSKLKKKSKSKTTEMIEIERIPYYYNKEYLRMLEDEISDEKNKILMIKYNILYNLIDEESVEKFDEIEENIKRLKEERDKVKFKIQRKEERKMKKLKDLNDRINILRFDYKEIPEDRKITYLEIQGIRDEINDIMNNNRCIILDDSHVKIYSVINDYEPIRDNEITEQNESINEVSESRSNNSGSNKVNSSKSNSGSNNSRISLEVESLD